jgi:hypothetical protein
MYLFLDYGNYGNNGGNNPYGGHMMGPPPRPAPSADGWSSGENQFDVFGQGSILQNTTSAEILFFYNFPPRKP